MRERDRQKRGYEWEGIEDKWVKERAGGEEKEGCGGERGRGRGMDRERERYNPLGRSANPVDSYGF